MEHLIALSIKFLNSDKQMDEDSIYILRYGLELFYLKAGFTSAILLLAVICGKFVETVVFLLSFSPVRTFAGGYHADTRMKCFVCSISIILLAVLGMELFAVSKIHLFFILMGVMSAIVIWIYAPIDTENKRLEQEECVEFQQRVRKILIFYGVLLFFAELFGWKLLSSAILISVIVNGILGWMQYQKNSKKTNK